MPPGADLPASVWAGRFRAKLAARRKRRGRLAAAVIAAIGAAPPLLSLAFNPPLLLLWNASASVPVGLYWVSPARASGRGDLVIARTPLTFRNLAARRGYLPANVPLVKRMAAAGGDRVCAREEAITINGRTAAVRRRTDSAGRAMPWWSGCRRLGPGEIFLLAARPDSFDGRYFGITRLEDLIGRAVLLWPELAKGTPNG